MELPFSHDAFLDVFGAYNTVLWPAAVVLWVVTAGLAWRWMRKGRIDGQGVFALLAVHWAWSGVAYHWLFFRTINPAATIFGAFFVLQAVLFAWLAVTSRAHFTVDQRMRGLLGGALVIYALAYPLVSVGFGLQYPRLPLFAVPCPTALVTAGLLLTSSGVPRLVNIVPILWAAIGSSAAFALGIRADFALGVAAALLTLDTLLPSALGVKTVVPGMTQ
ncbi:MAG: DUF6064 family protein [Vicinamibacterales bacterium]